MLLMFDSALTLSTLYLCMITECVTYTHVPLELNVLAVFVVTVTCHVSGRVIIYVASNVTESVPNIYSFSYILK